MLGNVFHTSVSDLGRLGINYNHSEALTVVCFRSPYASIKSNNWLERKLLRLYTVYYYKVLFETKGRFWKDVDKQALTYTKGGNGDGKI